MTRCTGRMGRHESVAIVLCLLVLLALYWWAARYRLDTLDEGYFIYTSSRVLAGEFPYRDFATPYTPAFFYLNALLFQTFGMDVVTVRLSQTVCRLALLLLTYLLGRRIMPPAFAALPVLVILAEDPVPGNWEVHPAWWASLLFVVCAWCVCRYREGSNLGWWLAAASFAGLAFSFKQNVGLFAVIALVGVALSEHIALRQAGAPNAKWLTRLIKPVAADRLLRVAAPAYLFAFAAAVGWLVRAHLSTLTFIQFIAPFVALGAERLVAGRRGSPVSVASDAGRRLAATSIRILLVAITFVAVSVPWLVALLALLGPSNTPLAAYIGGIDTSGYYLEIEELRPRLLAVIGMVVIVPAACWALFRPWRWPVKLVVSIAGGLLWIGCLQWLLAHSEAVHPSATRAASLLSVHATTNLVLYLPLAAFWAGFGLLLARRESGSDRFNLGWLLLAGSCLYLNQYPRTDEPHLLWSAPLLWVVGAYSMWKLWLWGTRELSPGPGGRFGKIALYLALLGLPLAAVWPNVETRRQEVVTRRPEGTLVFGAPHNWVPLELPGANVYETDEFAWKYRQLAAYLRANSGPGERIFVYPAAPLLYYLVDRPNATRFNHVLPGLLSPNDERDTIELLGTVPAAYVIWDTFGAGYWLEPDDYRSLKEYIWQRYEQVESIGGFEILKRKGG